MPQCETCEGQGFLEEVGGIATECPDCLGAEQCPKCGEQVDWDVVKEHYYCTVCNWEDEG